MKNSKNIFLSVILGGLVIVTAIAGIVTMSVKNNSGEELKETEIDESMQEYLWGSMAETKEAEGNRSQLAANETEAESLNVPVTREPVQTEASETQAVNLEAPQPETAEAPPADEGQAVAGSDVISLVFSEGSKMKWPVEGNVILGYSMDTTVYFSTLKQYKCNPGMLIQSEPGVPVLCPANALVNEVGYDDEIGNYVTMSLGNGYEIICGQLDGITVCEGDYINAGESIGVAASPTSYYVVEGCNIYLEVIKDDVPVDPLDFLE